MLLASASSTIDVLLARPGDRSGLSFRVPDETLGYRPNPEFPGHDKNGFRNESVAGKIEIVALGDSQTYGTGVASEATWPKQLEALIGEPVYNMAFPGYGPAHSLVLIDEAIELKPRVIIEAFYAGNDLYDSFNLVYNLNQLTELKSADTHTIEVVQDKESEEPIAELVGQMFRMDDESATTTFWHYLKRQNKIYGLLRRIKYQLRDKNVAPTWLDAKAFAERNSAFTEVFEEGKFRTIFTPEYRLTALNPSDPRIKEGQRISLEAIKLMGAEADANKMRFIALLVPTKEYVFSSLTTKPKPSFEALIAAERRFWTTTKNFLSRHGIEYIEALPALQNQLDLGNQPYKMSQDGHPNELGHAAIAELVEGNLHSVVSDTAMYENVKISE